MLTVSITFEPAKLSEFADGLVVGVTVGRPGWRIMGAQRVQEIRVLAVSVTVVRDHLFIFELLLKLLIPFSSVVSAFRFLQFVQQEFVLIDYLG